MFLVQHLAILAADQQSFGVHIYSGKIKVLACLTYEFNRPEKSNRKVAAYSGGNAVATVGNYVGCR